VTLDDLAHCFQKRHKGSTIFQDDGKKITGVGINERRQSEYIETYMPETLADVYLWRVSRRWGTLTTRLEDADVVLLLSFPLISKYAGKCNGTTHWDRQENVINWASENLNNNTPVVFVCPSWSGCDGIIIGKRLPSKNIKVLMKERNPKWLMPGYYGKDEFPQILDKWVKNTTRTRIIPYPANRNIERFHPRLLEIQDDVQYNNSNENVRITTSRTTPARSKTGVLFIGSLRGVEVRTIMSQIAHRNDTQIVTTNLGGQEGKIKSVKSYAQQMMAAQFCLCPSGDSPTARRLYDAIVAGCLPIVISDDIIRHVPFPQTIDYESFWFRIKEAEWISDPGAELDRVVATPVENIARRQNLMASYVSALDWTDSNNNDGLRLILDEIVMAGQRRPR